MKRYHNTRFSRPGSRGTVKPYGVEVSPNGTVYHLSAVKRNYDYWVDKIHGRSNHMVARVFWLHPTKGWRSQGART